MRSVSIYDHPGGTMPLMTVDVTVSFWQRIRSLSRRSTTLPNRGLIIEPCRVVRGCGRKGSIDVVFLDEQWIVLRAVLGLVPWLFLFLTRSRRVLKLEVGEAA